ncbi:L-histidine N(alpha)-methyltransferase [Glycomyces sp. TRM65418]|uniref:L-histidine N(alpha)-methyltransferase n=1 Tax=Glycomyces sp. TRM65418 TaxID=2867006 RepID=UPI001CE603A3|nr:L-histidine N(alpha)-methyltransferase [Glycomyces sp. TRM65418]MCC3763451.1 L-histidine N(alpha)-methyltransferase [Glycomyces sp. TRM65418]QZD57440.1 L-histidine N(alpha)-methyltransferase [Glycomyces sp. TRM65418]
MTTEAPGGSDEALRADALAGLTARPKTMPPKWCYDEHGSRLFERITRLPEYYLTRAETEILAARAPRIAADTAARSLIELGSGSSAKSRLLIDAMTALDAYVPVDVDPAVLRAAAAALRRDRPGLTVQPVVGDFQDRLRLDRFARPRLVAFLGSTVGNLLPDERVRFLNRIGDAFEPGDALLLGVDLVKDPATLIAAYDDAEGVTAAFNRNLLAVLNRRLGADFDPRDFAHTAVWDPGRERIEMRLRAHRALTVKLPALGLAIHFDEGEDLLTETSAKFRRESLEPELAAAGLRPRRWWTDAAGRFALSLTVKAG